MIPASANAPQICDCYRDLPLDTSHGPYPAVIFLHGTGSYRTASLTAMTQWASRGFVVVATDHAGLYLADFLGFLAPACAGMGSGVSYPDQDLNGDVDVMIAGLTQATGGFSFLGTHVDMKRIGIGGHSQGAANAAMCASKPNVQVDIPLADLGGAIPAGSALKSVLVMGGTIDSVVAYSSDQTAYAGTTAAKKRLVGITNGDHLDVTDLCIDVNTANPPETGIQVAMKYNVCGAASLAGIAKCGIGEPGERRPRDRQVRDHRGARGDVALRQPRYGLGQPHDEIPAGERGQLPAQPVERAPPARPVSARLLRGRAEAQPARDERPIQQRERRPRPRAPGARPGWRLPGSGWCR